MKPDHPLRYRFWGSTKPPAMKAGIDVKSSISATVADDVAVIRLYKPIDSWGGWFGVSASEFADLLDQLGSVKEVRVHFNSPGGDTFEGVAIANQLRGLEAHTVGIVDGLAASAAGFIAVACDETIMAPQSELMIHDAWGIAIGNEQEMLKYGALLGKTSQNIAGLYARHAGGSADDWRELMRAETWYTDEEAVASGLAQRVLGDDEEEPEGEPVREDDGPPIDSRFRFDLSMFNFAGRAAAPAPKIPASSSAGGPGPAAPAPGPTTTQEGASLVEITDETMNRIRQLAGVNDADADEGTVLAALEEALEEAAPETGSAAALPEGMVAIEADVLESLRAGAIAGTAARTEQLAAARDTAIQNAVRTGRISVARVAAWTTRWDKDPEGAAADLESLAPGLIPVSELGHDDQSADRDLASLVGPLATGSSSQALAEFANGFGLTEEDLRV